MEEKMEKKFQVCLVVLCGLLMLTGSAVAAPSPKELHGGVYGNGSHAMSLATGSPGQLGLVKALAEAFAAKEDVKVTWKEAQSGESLRLLGQFL